MRVGRAAWIVATAAVLFAVGATVVGPAQPAFRSWPPPASALAAYAIDEARAGEEVAQVLSDYLRVDTTNPPGNETRGARYLASVLAKEGIASEIVEPEPGRGNLLARLEAPSPTEPPLCLVSHIDVVPAEASRWPSATGPLSGARDAAGYLWGRGALDMKGMGALEVMTMVWLKRLAVPLRRHVVLIAAAAEESDSRGIRHLVDHRWGDIGCTQAVNEGSIGVRNMLGTGQTVYAISVAEKGVLWLRLKAHGEPGHGSTPMPTRAPNRLLRALARLEARRVEPRVHPSLAELSARIGRDHGGAVEFLLTHPRLARRFVVPRLLDVPPARATMFDTVNVTGFDGKSEPNVVPSEVTAILDVRLLPGTRSDDMLADLKRTVDDPDVSFEIIESVEGGENTWDDPLFDALARHVRDGRPNVVAGPTLSPGYTDSLYLRKKGVRAFGIAPFEIEASELASFHGDSERIHVDELRRGLRALYRSVVDVVVAP